MIRELQKSDIDQVADIWLDTNLKAHYFISAQYWKNNFELVKEMLSQAEVYVYENDTRIYRFKRRILLKAFLFLSKCSHTA